MRRVRMLRIARLGIASVWLLHLAACQTSEHSTSTTRTSEGPGLELTSLLSGDVGGFTRAVEPRRFEFPADHGPHPGFRTEWWYLTGNVATDAERRFGYQFTLFRNSPSADSPQRESRWGAREIYMAHLALTDVEGRRFHAFERFARGAAGLAGVEVTPFRAWLEDWQLTGGNSPPTFRLGAAAGEIALDLELVADKPLVLQGEAGLSRKGRTAGNASYYYSFTRLGTSGRIRLGDVDFEVQGTSWLDREWSTSALEAGQQGWDWFALQLDDGTEVMVYQMRRDDGTPDPVSSGSFIDATGAKTSLSWTDFRLEVLDSWTSPGTGIRYPSAWRLLVAAEDLSLEIEPLVRNQELPLSVVYWEGAVHVQGSRAGSPITGNGYVELTGYGTRGTGAAPTDVSGQ